MTKITMEDVAAAAGVSRSLVSLAYRGEPGVSDSTRTAILETGRRLGYTPNRVASRLAEGRGTTLGVFLQDLHNDVFAETYDGIRSITDAEGTHSLLAVGELDGSRDESTLETLQQSRVDVILAAGLQLPDSEVQRVNEDVPLVSIARMVPHVDSVYSDNRTGSDLATTHLLALGHRDILFLANPLSDGYEGRRQGFEAAMRRAGLTGQIIGTSYDRSEAAKDAGRALDSARPPSAIFAHNDQAAIGVLHALASRGLRPGQDVSVVGYDNSALSRTPGAEITTVDIRSHALGRAAAELALQRRSDHDAEAVHRVFAPELVIRGSSAPAS